MNYRSDMTTRELHQMSTIAILLELNDKDISFLYRLVLKMDESNGREGEKPFDVAACAVLMNRPEFSERDALALRAFAESKTLNGDVIPYSGAIEEHMRAMNVKQLKELAKYVGDMAAEKVKA